MAFMMISVTAKAALLTGVLSITGSVDLTTDSIAFGTNSSGNNPFSINSGSAQQGDFVDLAGSTGTIKNIVNPPYATGVIFSTTGFMTFSVAPNITITLEEIDAGIDGSSGCSAPVPAGGQVCTPIVPDQSPFNFQNTSASTSTATFNITGVEVDSLTSTSIMIDGIFTIPLNASFQTVLATINGGGTVTSAFSASLATESSNNPPPPSVPEPNTWTSMAIGGAGMCLVGLKRLRA
jgi:hypothetical protein